MKIKISNVCQLVDPKYIRTIVDRGVTFTSNGDGSITVNGTPTGEYYSVGTIALNTESIKPNHKYVVYDVNKDPIISELIIANYQGGYIYKGIGNIFTFPEHPYTRFVFEIRVNLNQTANNIVVRPQLFDLTEMYGAGNEPKTVAEFRKDFPNEMYEYSPECWKRCKELKYVTETKNLFDKSNAQIINGYISGINVFSGSTLDKTIIVPCLPNTTYTFSKISLSPVVCDRLRIGDYTAIPAVGDTINNVVNIGEPPTQNYITITTSDTAKYIVVTIGLFKQIVTTTLDYILSTCQLELGSTATPYQPYGYLPLRTGRYRTETRNLFDINAEMHDANKPAYYIEVMGNIVKTNYDISHVGHPYIEVPVEIGETYTFSCNAYRSSDIINVYSRVRYPDNTVVTYIGNGPVKKTFTATQSSIQVCFGIDTYGSWDTSQFALIYNIQLEKGTTATHYQSYKHIYFH